MQESNMVQIKLPDVLNEKFHKYRKQFGFKSSELGRHAIREFFKTREI